MGGFPEVERQMESDPAWRSGWTGPQGKGIGAIISVHAEQSSGKFRLFGSPGEDFSQGTRGLL